jgi:hypothetical protein
MHGSHDSSSSFEELDGALVFFRGIACFERPDIPALSGFRDFLSRIQTITTVFEFSNHRRRLVEDTID